MVPSPRISIIVPVYNIAAYLDACIGSILNQSFIDFELLLVDDGSTDGSSALCDAFANADARIRVLHRSHSGPSAARNTGIDAARGNHIGFVDGDDWIEPDMYALLYENSVTYDADLSACGFIKISDIRAMQFSSTNRVAACYTPAQALEAVFRPDHMRYSACNKLFRRQLFEGIRFPEGKVLEDKATIYRLIHGSNRIAWCASPKYHYFMRPNSIMHASPAEKQEDVFQVNDELIAFITQHYPALRGTAGASYAAECVKLFRQLKHDRCITEKCRDVIRTYLWPGIASKNLTLATKLQLLTAAFLPRRFN